MMTAEEMAKAVMDRLAEEARALADAETDDDRVAILHRFDVLQYMDELARGSS